MQMRLLKVMPLAGCLIALVALAPATASAQTAGWTAGPGAALSNTYTGFIDSPTSGATVPGSGSFDLNGWFVDTTAQGWAGADQVQVFLGQMNNGGTMLAQGVVGMNRPDVATALGNPYWAASGFFVSVPSSSIPAGTQTLSVYLHTPAKGWWFEPLAVSGGGPASTSTAAASAPGVSAVATGLPEITVSEPTENEDVSTRNGDFTVTGTVSSPGARPSDIDRVEVWINGERDTGALLGSTTPLSDGSWSVTFTPTHFTSTHSNLYVYAHSSSTGKETLVVRGFNITDR
jgi:hypothetical protein